MKPLSREQKAKARVHRPDYSGSAAPEILFVVDPITAGKDADVPPDVSSPINRRLKDHLIEYCVKHQIPRNKAAIIRACPPVLRNTWDSDKKMSDHIKAHRDEFIANVFKAKPKLIVAMGKWAARQTFRQAVQITKVRGTPKDSEEFQCLVFPTLGLEHTLRVPETLRMFDADFATLKKIVDGGYTKEYQDDLKADYQWCTDLKPLIKRAVRGEKLSLAVDTEYTGGEYYQDTARLLTVQIATGPGECLIVPVDYNHQNHKRAPNPVLRTKLLKQLKKLLEHNNVSCFGQNFKGDVIWLRWHAGIEVKNWEDDTICLMHGVDENMLNKSLDEIARQWVPEMSGYADEFNRDPIHEDKTRMDKVPPDKMLQYGCGDVDATYRAKLTLEAELQKDKKQYRCYRNVVMPALRAFAQIEDHGFPIDKKALKAFELMLRAHQKLEYRRIRAMVPKQIARVYLDDEKYGKWDKSDRKNPKLLKPASITRPDFLRAWLFKPPWGERQGFKLVPQVWTKGTRNEKDEKKRIPSTSGKNHLAYFEDDDPAINAIMEYIKSEKLLGTYVGTDGTDEDAGDNITGFYRYIFDGRIRPSYLLHRTVTGRTASANPNGQNFPKRGKLAKKYREIFVAPPGYVLLEVDFSQIELRIAAIMAQEPTMLGLYRRGADIHAATAAAVMGISLEEFNDLPKDIRDHKRFQAKAVNFGFLYGMGWRKFITYARTEYKITFNEDEAQEIRATFFKLYSRLKNWHTAMRNYVQEHGYVRSYSGRIRHLPSVFSHDEAIASGAERQAINSPVQGFGSDLGLCAIRLLVDNVPFNLVRPIGFIHDALVCLAPEKRAKEAAAAVKYWMEHVPLKKLFNFEPPIPIIAEASVGKNLSSMIEIPDEWYELENVCNWHDIQTMQWRSDYKRWKSKKTEAIKEGKEIPRCPVRPLPPRTVKGRRLRVVQKRRSAITIKPAPEIVRIKRLRKVTFKRSA